MRSIINAFRHDSDGKKGKHGKNTVESDLNTHDGVPPVQAVPPVGTNTADRTDAVPTEVVPGAHARTDVVAVPGADKGLAEMAYHDAEIGTTSKAMEVSAVREAVVAGQAIAFETQTQTVPRTEMRMENIQVPDVHIETRTTQMPVTVTKQVPEIVKDVEMRSELVTREEVVMEQRDIDVPTTEMRRVTVEKPALEKFDVTVARPDEYLKEIKVVRPEVVVQRVTREIPRSVTRTHTVRRPELVTRRVLAQQPKQVAQPVRIMQPELRSSVMPIQVPQTETREVSYQKPVTVIRPAEGVGLIRHDRTGSVTSSSSSSASEAEVTTTRDMAKVPVGIPFTEVLEEKAAFTVTQLREEDVNLRETWMIPVEITRLDYVMEPVEVEITETVWRDYTEEYVETVLDKEEVDVEVTVMREVMEKWPVNKQHKEVITTSEVVLQPHEAVVAQLTSKRETIDVPHKQTVTETIEKAVPVEREVLVDKAVTEMREVPVEVTVEGTRTIQVERPYITQQQIQVEVPTTVQRDLLVENVEDRMTQVTEETAYETDKHLTYRTLQPGMHATAVPKDSIIAPMVKHAHLTTSDVERAHVEAEVQQAQAKFASAAELEGFRHTTRDTADYVPGATNYADTYTTNPNLARDEVAYTTPAELTHAGKGAFVTTAEGAAAALRHGKDAHFEREPTDLQGGLQSSRAEEGAFVTDLEGATVAAREGQHVHFEATRNSFTHGYEQNSSGLNRDSVHNKGKRVVYSSSTQEGIVENVAIDPMTGQPILDPVTGKPLVQMAGSRGLVDPTTGKEYMSQEEMLAARKR